MRFVTVVSTLCAMACAFFLQALADRHGHRFDLTLEGAFTLSYATKRALSEVTAPIRVTAFVATGDPARTDVDGLLRQVVRCCPRISYRLVDPDEDPVVARELGISTSRVLVFWTPTRVVTGRGCREVHLLAGLRRLLRTTTRRICLLVGHGERDPLSPQRDGSRMFAESLVAAGLEVVPLSLQAAATAVPADCGAVVVVGPQRDLLDDELAALRRFLADGGGMVLFAERLPGPGWQALLGPWGLGLGAAVVVDPVQNVSGRPLDVIALDARAHPSVRTVEAVVLHGARPVVLSKADGVRHEGVLYASRHGWGETSVDDGEAAFDPAVDVPPPVLLAAAAERTVRWRSAEEEVTARVLLVGDDFLAANGAYREAGNADLAVGAVEWAAGYGENVIMLPKTFMVRELYVTPGQFRVVFLVVVFGMPLLAGACGLLVAVRRQ